MTFPSEPQLSADLQARAHPNFAFHFEVPLGWIPLVNELHEKLVVLDPDYKVCQAKEKFGGLRFYVALSPKAEMPKTDVLIEEYEKRSMVTCQRCSKPGETRNKRGWLSTLCDECAGTSEGLLETHDGRTP